MTIERRRGQLDTILEAINRRRRHFLGASAAAVAAAQLGMVGSAAAQTDETKAVKSPAVKPGTSTSFGLLRQVDAVVLNVGYAEAGPADGPAVVLLHGWPYDIHTYVDITPLLASAGYRVIVPYLRGYGTTRFRSSETLRNGQQAVVAVDAITLMDALRIEMAILGGCDWGARTANVMAALWPERVRAMVSVSGYLIGSQEADRMPLPPKAELQWWYQYYFATERGRAGYEANRREFAKLIWQIASPQWDFDDATFERSAASFDNPDHVAIVIHNYRWRLGLAESDPKLEDLEKRLATFPVITVPTITLEGDVNGAPASGPRLLRREVRWPIRAPDHHGRHRAQSAPGSAKRLCASHHRCQSDLSPMHDLARHHIAGAAVLRCSAGKQPRETAAPGSMMGADRLGSPAPGTRRFQSFSDAWLHRRTEGRPTLIAYVDRMPWQGNDTTSAENLLTVFERTLIQLE